MTAVYIFSIIAAFTGVANCQDDSCLFQARFKNAESTNANPRESYWSVQEQQRSLNYFNSLSPFPEKIRSAHRQNGFKKGDRLPICITGQIGRLELHSKIQNLIQPAVDQGHKVEVYLVLDPRNATTYVHGAAGTRVGNYTIVEGSFTNLNETAGLFPSKVSVILDPFIPQDYSIDHQYANYLIKTNHDVHGQGHYLTPLQAGELRAKSHVRQWEMLSRCWELFHATDDTPPKAALRIRDDLSFVAPYMPGFETLSRGIHVLACESYHGLNDKLAMLSGHREVESYFTGPLSYMRHNFSAIVSAQRARGSFHMNPESVLFNTMAMSKIDSYSAEIPCYKATFLRDAQEKVHVCYLTHGKGSCFEKIWPFIENRTTGVLHHEKIAYFCETK